MAARCQAVWQGTALIGEKKPGAEPGFQNWGVMPTKTAWMLLACFLPLLPCVTSRNFLSLFQRLETGHVDRRKMREQIFAAAVGVIKPKPFESLNHFTVPVAICAFLKEIKRGRSSPTDV